jgi:flagellar motility protein MotE (MotC chaperone)
MILPEMPEETEEDTATYNFETVEEAIEVLKITENMLKESGQEAEKLSEQITQLTAEVDRLKVFEGNQLQFEADKQTFDNLVASNAEAIVFKDWFEKMNPQNAADIYAQVIEEVKYDEDLKGLVNIYQSMKPAQAAGILEDMTVTQLDLVASIIKNLSADQSADVLGAMEPATAAKITTYLSPQQ